jgi:hypothetical protein
MDYEKERKTQIIIEIEWLKNKLKTAKGEKHRRDINRQITESEYNLYLGIFKK